MGEDKRVQNNKNKKTDKTEIRNWE